MDVTHSNVTVHNKRNPQHAVNEGVLATSGDNSSSRDWHQRGREEALKGPVIRSVGSRRRREGCRVVHGALEDSCGKSKHTHH